MSLLVMFLDRLRAVMLVVCLLITARRTQLNEGKVRKVRISFHYESALRHMKHELSERGKIVHCVFYLYVKNHFYFRLGAFW